MEPFKISVPSPVIDDLNQRLAQTRWPDQINGTEWQLGTELEFLKKLCNYWQQQYDWRKEETLLNKFHHFKTQVDGFGLHYIHEKGKGSKNIPLLLIHGWPDSFYRFKKLIPLLTLPNENSIAFDVIVPSIPGFGYSDRPVKQGMNRQKIAELFHLLMTRHLNYESYCVQGGDWGGSIGQQMALLFKANIMAIHLSSIPSPIIFSTPTDQMNAEEIQYYTRNKQWQQTEGTFTLLQSTKPQTLGYELNDSPAGLAGWYIEKFKNWSDNIGNIEERINKDDLLTNLSIYWFTQTAASAERLYWEGSREEPIQLGQRVEVPTYFALFPKDILQMPEHFARRYFNVAGWQQMAAGGHFAALEVPELMDAAIRQALIKYS